MSTGIIKKPSRPPPPPPKASRSDYIKISECHTGLPAQYHHHRQHSTSSPYGSSGSFSSHNNNNHNHLVGFKSRNSASFSSASLRPPSSRHSHHHHPPPAFGSSGPAGKSGLGGVDDHLYQQHHTIHHTNHAYNQRQLYKANHQKSRSLTERSNYMSPSTVYRQVDFPKTEALNSIKVNRTSGRGSDLLGQPFLSDNGFMKGSKGHHEHNTVEF